MKSITFILFLRFYAGLLLTNDLEKLGLVVKSLSSFTECKAARLTIWHWLPPQTLRTPAPPARPSSPSDPPGSSRWRREALQGDRREPGEPNQRQTACWTSSALLTFNKELRGALLLSDHAAVRRVVGQRAVVDGEVAHAADALEDVPLGRRLKSERRWKRASNVASFAPANLLAWVSTQVIWRERDNENRHTHTQKKDSSAFAALLINTEVIPVAFTFQSDEFPVRSSAISRPHLDWRPRWPAWSYGLWSPGRQDPASWGRLRFEEFRLLTRPPLQFTRTCGNVRTNRRFSSPLSSSSSAASACLSCRWCRTERQSSDTPRREPCSGSPTRQHQVLRSSAQLWERV